MSSNHRDGPDYNEQSKLDHPCKHTCSGWQQGYVRGMQNEKVFNGVDQREMEALRKELQSARAENEAYMSTDYWHDRYKAMKKEHDQLRNENTDLKEWLISKDEQIDQLNMFIEERIGNERWMDGRSCDDFKLGDLRKYWVACVGRISSWTKRP